VIRRSNGQEVVKRKLVIRGCGGEGGEGGRAETGDCTVSEDVIISGVAPAGVSWGNGGGGGGGGGGGESGCDEEAMDESADAGAVTAVGAAETVGGGGGGGGIICVDDWVGVIVGVDFGVGL
jgi:hypothetical protein